MEIISHKKQYLNDFKQLNIAWLERFFWVEPCDQEQIDNVESIIEQGGMVHFALEQGEVVATCMTMPLDNGSWEMCKFAARNQYTGTGAGSAVFKASMDFALDHGAQRLVLISCRSLKPALHIYRKFGFKEIPLQKEYWGAEKADIQMEFIPSQNKNTPLRE